MTATLEAVFGRNITLLYNSISLPSINLVKAKEIFTDGEPAIVQLPGAVTVFNSQSSPLTVQIDSKRIVINAFDDGKDLGNYPLCNFAIKFNELIVDNSKIEAFGFNYNFGFLSDENLSESLLSFFSIDVIPLMKSFGGSIVDFCPNFKVEGNGSKFNYVFEKHSEVQLKVHVNSHFIAEKLPEELELKKYFVENYEIARDNLENFMR